MIRKAPALALLMAALTLAACSAPAPPGAAPDSDAERVRILLPVGEVEAGKQAFIDLGCVSCHVVSGVPDLPPPTHLETAVDLTASVRGLSRSAIVTGIIAPAHVDSQSAEFWTEWSGEERIWLGPGQHVDEAEEAAERTGSRMSNFGHVMTVQQLTDLTAFVGSVAAQK